MMRSFLGVFALSVLLSGCTNNDMPDLQGRFVGAISLGAQSHQVVAQIPALTKLAEGYGVDVALTETLATSRPEHVLVVVGRNNVGLTWPAHGIDVQLKRTGECGALEAGGHETRVCWPGGKIEVSSSDATGQPLSLTLERNDGLPPLSDPAHGLERSYSIDELLGRAKFASYSVQEQAESVFRSKQAITVAVGNLLPHLNLRDGLAFASSGYMGIFEAAGDLLPFLFPSNWYKWKEAKELARAEKKSFASLRGNEMNAVALLAYGVLRDQTVLQKFGTHLSWLRRVQSALATQEDAGALPHGSADYFGTSVHELEQDEVQLKGLVAEELAQLAHAVALPPLGAMISVAEVSLPDLSSVQPLDPATFYRDAESKSLEVATLRWLAAAASSAKYETAFAFLDPASSGSLGFGLPASIAIDRSHEREIQMKVQDTLSLIESRSVLVTTRLTAAVGGFKAAAAGGAEASRRFDWLWQRRLAGDVTLGDQEFLDGLVELQKKILVFEMSRLASQYAYLADQAQLDRLLLNGAYSNLEEN